MQKKVKILLVAFALSFLVSAVAIFYRVGTEEQVAASSDCWKDYGTAIVECVGTEGVCILYGGGLDKVCPGSAYSTEIPYPENPSDVKNPVVP